MRERASKYSYGYACGRVNALETKLVDRARLQRMIDAADAAEALRVLAETDYAGALNDVRNPAEFERVLAAELDSVYALLAELSPEEFLVRLFGYRFDFHNLKVLLKARALDQDHSHLLVSRGTLPAEQVKAALSGGDELPKPFGPAVAAAEAAYDASGDPQLIDTMLDGALYEVLADEARRRSYQLVHSYMQASIDLTNIRTALRVRRLGKDETFLKQVLLSGGTIEAKRFLALHDQPFELFEDHFSRTPYWRIVTEGVRLLRENAPLAGLEKLTDDYLNDIVKRAKYVPMGPEPLFAYILAKESEIRNIRIILAGKLNGVPAGIIRERLRDSYV